MKKYTFKNGDVVTSELSADELVRRMRRLDVLRVMTEGYEEGVGVKICQKALRAYNKVNGFTGIVRLTTVEKDFLGYLYENSHIDDEEVKVLDFYTKC